MSKPNYTITRTRARSTTELGYHSLPEYAGPVPHHQAPAPPALASQTAAFGQGIADTSHQGQHVVRQMVASFVVGAAVGEAVARMRHGRRTTSI